MRLTAASLALGAVLAIGASCATVRSTGPKTAHDRCVDDCDNDAFWCSHPGESQSASAPSSTHPPGCIDYDACVVACARRHRASR